MDNEREDFLRRQEERALDREARRLRDDRKRFILSRGGLTAAFFSVALASELFGAKIQPRDVGFVFDLGSTESVQVVQSDPKDYTSKVYYVEAGGKSFELPFDEMDSAVPQVLESWSSVNLAKDNEDPTVVYVKREEVEDLKKVFIEGVGYVNFAAAFGTGIATASKVVDEYNARIAENEKARDAASARKR